MPLSEPNASFRILQVTDATGWRGGERQVLYLLQTLQARGYPVALACPRNSPVARRFQQEGIPVFPLALRGGPLRALPDLLRAVRRFRPHLVVAQSSGAHTLVLLAALVHPLPPLVVHRRRPSAARTWSRWKYRSPRIRRYIAISRFVAQSLRDLGVPEQRIAVVPSALAWPLPPVPRPETLGLPKDRPLVGTIAAFTREKNLDFWLQVLAEVLRQVSEVHGVLVGEGYLEPRLREVARGLGLRSRVSFLRYRPGIAGTFTVFLSTSRIEGLGTALMEALAYGVPVVAPAVGGIPEVVVPGQSGLLVSRWQRDAFAREVVHLLRHPELRAKMASFARQDIPRRFSLDTLVRRTLEVYREALA